MPDTPLTDDRRDKLIRSLVRTCVETDAWIIALKELLVAKRLITEEEFLVARTAAAQAQVDLLREGAVESRQKALLELLAAFEGPIH